MFRRTLASPAGDPHCAYFTTHLDGRPTSLDNKGLRLNREYAGKP